MRPVIALTGGEPAGIGLDLMIDLIPLLPHDADLVYIGDPDLLAERGLLIGKPLNIVANQVDAEDQHNQKKLDHVSHAPEISTHQIRLVTQPASSRPLFCLNVPCQAPCTAAVPSTDTAAYVLETLEVATRLCLNHQAHAFVTGPVHKAIINRAGFHFTGHTEWLASRTQAKQVVMLLANPQLRVALTTTHIPLSSVKQAIHANLLKSVIRTLDHQMRTLYGIKHPRIAVLGLNPHAGEQGHLGQEEITLIQPCIEALRKESIDLMGPLPADTAFLPQIRQRYDVVLAHYHDQGLPVLKALDFDQAINVTLGLPIIRTSVDHGTAYDLVGKGLASVSSLSCAVAAAIRFAQNKFNSVYDSTWKTETDALSATQPSSTEPAT